MRLPRQHPEDVEARGVLLDRRDLQPPYARAPRQLRQPEAGGAEPGAEIEDPPGVPRGQTAGEGELGEGPLDLREIAQQEEAEPGRERVTGEADLGPLPGVELAEADDLGGERVAGAVIAPEDAGSDPVDEGHPAGIEGGGGRRRRHSRPRVITSGGGSGSPWIPGAPGPTPGETKKDSSSTRPPLGWLVLAAITMALVLVSVWATFVHAPVEMRMGVVQKIFYIHVPSAYAMYVGFVVCAVGSAIFLVKRDEKWDALAVAGAEVGLLFCLVVLITGPLWARKAWGYWWTWDPRLTTTLLAGMIFTAYVVLRSFGGGEAERRFAAGLAIVGQIGRAHV